MDIIHPQWIFDCIKADELVPEINVTGVIIEAGPLEFG